MNQVNHVEIVTTFRFNEELSPELYERIGVFIRTTGNDPECVEIRLMGDIEQPEYFTIVMEWKSSAAIEKLKESEHFADFLAMLATKTSKLYSRTQKRLNV